MIAEELHVTFRAARDHMAKHGYKPRRVRERFVWPKDAAWYASRTTKEICKELGICENTVRNHILTRKYKVRPSDAVRRVNWPKDAAWYASRTIKEMSAELNISVSTVRTYVHRWKIPYKLVRNKRLTQ
jgi:DNA-binding CsgD family transcriptional regulator